MKAGVPRRFDEASLLGMFSGALLDLHAIADRTAAGAFLADAIGQFRRVVPFDSGWWGECSAPVSNIPPTNWQHGSLGLPASFASEWNAIGAVDTFARQSMSELGTVCRDSGYELDAAAVGAFARRHRLYHAMAVTCDLPGSGLMFFVSVYRHEGQPAFSDTDAILFGEYCKHVRLQWSARLKQSFRGGFAGSVSGMALCERSGAILYVGSALADLIRKGFPAWQGTLLPSALAARLGQVPGSLKLGRTTIALRPCGDLVALTMGGVAGQETLSPREREAAVLYATGMSYKDIAHHLRLSPATVRSYLRDAYSRLGVKNKLELRALLVGAADAVAP